MAYTVIPHLIVAWLLGEVLRYAAIMILEIIGTDVYILGYPLTEEKGVTPEKVLLAGCSSDSL